MSFFLPKFLSRMSFNAATQVNTSKSVARRETLVLFLIKRYETNVGADVYGYGDFSFQSLLRPENIDLYY